MLLPLDLGRPEGGDQALDLRKEPSGGEKGG